MIRIGFGVDVHAFVKQRKLILGGINIPFSKGLSGHSDADVLVHAIIDALLGAAALGDIGLLFPDTNAKYKNANSLELLKKINTLLSTNDFQIENIDTTIVLQHPNIQQNIPDIKKNISETLNIPISQISVKATTTEYLGFTGREEGIAAFAVVSLLTKK